MSHLEKLIKKNKRDVKINYILGIICFICVPILIRINNIDWLIRAAISIILLISGIIFCVCGLISQKNYDKYMLKKEEKESE